jgi:Uncharacterized conserved protein
MKEHHLQIENFGPIEKAEVTLNDILLFIGPQSSGKSTISKLFYFFLHIRDEYVKYLIESTDKQQERYLVKNFAKFVRKRFLEFWGPSPQDRNLRISYTYKDGVNITIELDSSKHRFIDPQFSASIKSDMKDKFRRLKEKRNSSKGGSNFFNSTSIIASEINDTAKIESLFESAKDLFNFDEELLFIPAGRSLLSTLSDQLQYIHPHQLDYPMRSFIERINNTKSFFGKSLDDLMKERQLTSTRDVWFSVVRKVSLLIRKILNGDYIYDKDGGKIYVNSKSYMKINFASSGQQESIWILLSLFLVCLEKVKARIFIEEPEAHLFPIAQKQMVELISFLNSTMNSKFVITTHSPYILSALNNHIYAFELSKSKSKEVSVIIDKSMWIDFHKVSGWFVEQGLVEQMEDESLRMLKAELIDSASEIVNEEYDKLFMLESEENLDD